MLRLPKHSKNEVVAPKEEESFKYQCFDTIAGRPVTEEA
jgi:hypothetical protein